MISARWHLHALEMLIVVLPPGQELGVFQGLLAPGDKPWCFCRGRFLLLSSSHPLPVVFVLDHFLSPGALPGEIAEQLRLGLRSFFRGGRLETRLGGGPRVLEIFSICVHEGMHM